MQTFSVMKEWTHVFRIQTSKTELFAKIVNGWKLRLHLRCSTGFWMPLWVLLPRNFLCTFREESFAGKKLEELTNEFCKFFLKLHRKNYCFFQKSLNTISLNKKIKWLKFFSSSLLKAKKETYLPLNKGPSDFFEKFNWKFRTSCREILIKSVYEFLKLVN